MICVMTLLIGTCFDTWSILYRDWLLLVCGYLDFDM